MAKVSFSKGESWSKFDSYYEQELFYHKEEEYCYDYDDNSIIDNTIDYIIQE